jgi:hypothetical protein
MVVVCVCVRVCVCVLVAGRASGAEIREERRGAEQWRRGEERGARGEVDDVIRPPRHTDEPAILRRGVHRCGAVDPLSPACDLGAEEAKLGGASTSHAAARMDRRPEMPSRQDEHAGVSLPPELVHRDLQPAASEAEQPAAAIPSEEISDSPLDIRPGCSTS